MKKRIISVTIRMLWEILLYLWQLPQNLLGLLYLLVIGLPSLLWAWLHRYIAPDKSYYWFYTERWADLLGRVKR